MDSQLPLDRSKRHTFAPGFLNRFPSLPLKERRLVRGCDFKLAGGRRPVSFGSLFFLFLRLESGGSRAAVQRSPEPFASELGTVSADYSPGQRHPNWPIFSAPLTAL